MTYCQYLIIVLRLPSAVNSWQSKNCGLMMCLISWWVMRMTKDTYYLTILLRFFHVGNENVKRHPLFNMTYYQCLIIPLRISVAINS